jgi:hypothetical protein
MAVFSKSLRQDENFSSARETGYVPPSTHFGGYRDLTLNESSSSDCHTSVTVLFHGRPAMIGCLFKEG